MCDSTETRFVHNLVTRDSYPRSYLEFAVNKAIQTSCAMGLKFQEYISIPANDHSYVTNSLTRLKQRICESQKTRYKTYMDINPRLISCPLYSAKDNLVPEYARMCVTRLRLSSHHLRIETGRWSRTQREDRTCTCGQVQTEEHVLLNCEPTAQLRSEFPYISNYNTISDIAVFCYKELKEYS